MTVNLAVEIGGEYFLSYTYRPDRRDAHVYCRHTRVADNAA